MPGGGATGFRTAGLRAACTDVANGLLPSLAEVTCDDAANAGQRTGQAEVGQHAVDAVEGLVDVFDEEERVVEAGGPRGAEHGGEEAQAAAEDGAFGVGFAEPVEWIAERALLGERGGEGGELGGIEAAR